ncbi:5813_t:CDS:1, partial [Paraglomus occultum]
SRIFTSKPVLWRLVVYGPMHFLSSRVVNFVKSLYLTIDLARLIVYRKTVSADKLFEETRRYNHDATKVNIKKYKGEQRK